MKIDLAGKTAVVTGSTSGIGLATARGLANAGARVVVNGRSSASVDKALGQLRADVPDIDALGVAADIGTAAGCATLVQAVSAVDILVNNAGTFALQDGHRIARRWRRGRHDRLNLRETTQNPTYNQPAGGLTQYAVHIWASFQGYRQLHRRWPGNDEGTDFVVYLLLFLARCTDTASYPALNSCLYGSFGQRDTGCGTDSFLAP